MDNIVLIIISGLVFPIIIVVLSWLFKVRQLYLVVPKKYNYGALRGKGNVVELNIFNRGRSIEEDVHINLPPDIECDIIAADSPDISINDKFIKIDRLTPSTEISMIILVEGNVVSNEFSPTISSKQTKGKIFKRTSDVPPNYGTTILLILGLILFTICAASLYPAYDYMKGRYIVAQHKEIVDDGFEEYGLIQFFNSDISQNYKKGEFPIRFIKCENGVNDFDCKFRLVNKTAVPMGITAFAEDASSKNFERFYEIIDIKSLQSGELNIKLVPKRNIESSSAIIMFSIQFGQERFYIKYNCKFK